MRKIFLDIETRNSFQDVGSAESTALDISVVCIYDSETKEFSSYLQEDLPKLWPILESADSIITFNGDHFDLPLLNKYYSGDLLKMNSLDILKEVRKSLGHRVGLGAIAQATLGVGKSGHGLEAIEWWRKGEIEKIVKYCIEDVRITKEVYDYALEHKKLKYKDEWNGDKIVEFPIDTANWEEKEDVKLTFSLPF
jgi:DEAD/DEAH box helicase domain-containing protein